MNIFRSISRTSDKSCLPYVQICKQFKLIFTRTYARKPPPRTAVLMVYTGGPKCEEEIECFVQRVLQDEMLSYGCLKHKSSKQTYSILPQMHKKYASIGNQTPQFAWIKAQTHLVEERLDNMCSSTAPHKTFLGCQYVKPSIFDALRDIQKHQSIENMLVLPMYPQYSCGLTGGCFNTIYRFYKENNLSEHIKWAVVDSWATTYSLIKNTAYLIKKALIKCDPKEKPYILIFAARPMPQQVFAVGDFYPYLVGATTLHVMRHVGEAIPYTLAWHDGPAQDKWLEPTVEDTLKDLVCRRKKWFMLVPISTVVENLITYHDYDVYLQHCLLPQLGKNINLLRIAAPNVSDLFITSVVQVCKEALTKTQNIPIYLRESCTLCQNPMCIKYKKWFSKLLTKHRLIACKQTPTVSSRP